MERKIIFERGQALILITFAAIVLFAIAGLGIDGSAKFSDRRHAQNAADTAALAGAYALGSNDTTWTTVARDLAGENGYTGDLVNNQVWVYRCNDSSRTNAPLNLNCGQYEGRSDYIEVIILSRVTTYFVRVLGINQSTNVVQAVALARTGGPSFNGASIVSLDPSPSCGNGSVKLSGSGTVTLDGGGLFVNSSVSCGFKEPNCTNFVVKSGGVTSAGSPIDLNSCHGTTITKDTTKQQFVIPDDIFIPTKPSVCTSKSPSGSYVKTKKNEYTIYPGYYTSFPPVTNSKYILTLEDGIYCIDGDIKWTNGTFEQMKGSNITFYITSGHSFDMSGGVLTLSATTSGTYAGYLIILDGKQSSIQDCKINGGGGGVISGSIFAPYCNIQVNGDSGTDAYSTQVIGYDVTLNGNNYLNMTYDGSKVAQDPQRVGLMK